MRSENKNQTNSDQLKNELARIKSSRSYKLACLLERFLSRPYAFLKKLRGTHTNLTPLSRMMTSGFPPSFQHMGRSLEGFQIQDSPDEPGKSLLYWQGNIAGNIRALSEINNTASGACFLVGTGPSINQIDFTKLKGIPCFAVNGAVIKFAEAGFKPEYYAVSTYDFFKNRFNTVKNTVLSGTACFFPFWGFSSICEQDFSCLNNGNLFHIDSVNQRYGKPKMSKKIFRNWAEQNQDFLLNDKIKNHDDNIGFSKNMEIGYFHGENILYTALQIAYYIGFRRFFILGMDLNYSGDQPRFYENKDDSRPTWIDESYDRSIKPCFEIIKALIHKKELEVFNLSINSRLPSSVIPNISIDQAFEMMD